MQSPKSNLQRAFNWTFGLFAFMALMVTGRVDAAFSAPQSGSENEVDLQDGGVAYVNADDVDSQGDPVPSME